MKKRVIFIALLALGILSLALLYFRIPADPVYEGRKLSSWLDDLHPAFSGTAFSAARQEKAFTAIRAIGTNGVPYLISLVRSRDSALWLKLVAWSNKQNLLKWGLKPHAPDRQFQGALGLEILGPDGSAAVSDLIALLREGDHSARNFAADALARFSVDARPAIPQLLQSLQDPDSDFRARVLNALGEIGPLTPEIIPAVEKCLHDPSPNIRSDALSCLLQFSNNRTDRLPQLLAQLKDEAAEVRGFALAHVEGFASARAQLRPAVVALCNDKDVSIRCAATNALEQLTEPATAETSARDDEKYYYNRIDSLRQLIENYSIVTGENVELTISLATAGPFGAPVRSYRGLSQSKALSLLDAALSDRFHLVIRRTGDGRLIAEKVPSLE